MVMNISKLLPHFVAADKFITCLISFRITSTWTFMLLVIIKSLVPPLHHFISNNRAPDSIIVYAPMEKITQLLVGLIEFIASRLD